MTLDPVDHQPEEAHHLSLREPTTALRCLVVLMPVGLHQPHDFRTAAKPARRLISILLVQLEDDALVLAHEVRAVHTQAG